MDLHEAALDFTAELRTTRPENTADAYGQWSRRFADFVGTSEAIDGDAIQRFVVHLAARDVAPRSVRLAVTASRKFLAWLERRGVAVASQGLVETATPDDPERWTPSDAEVERLVARCASVPPPEGPALSLLPYTGMRVSELLRLTFDDTELVGGGGVIFTVRRSKTHHGRRVPLMPEGARHLRDYLVRTRPILSAGPHLFPGLDQGGRKRTERYLREIRNGLGMPRLTHHALRRWFVRTLRRRNVADSDIAKIIGHSNLQTFLDYYQPEDEDLLRAVNSPQPERRLQ